MRSAWNRRWGGYLLAVLVVASIAASCGPGTDVRTDAGDHEIAVTGLASAGVPLISERSR